VAQIFLSHSSSDNAGALALSDWLVSEGWDDLFLDLDPERGVAAGERWERALYQAATRCDAVLLLVSRNWLASEWCLREFDLAHRLNKRIFGILIEELPLDSLPEKLTATSQVVNLAGGTDHEVFRVVHPDSGEERHVNFSATGLKRLHAGLQRAGLDPKFFEWPPPNDPDRPPYRGMRALEAKDVGVFFGREAPTIELLAKLRGLRDKPSPRVLVVLGASGAGKSSFMRAGLLPRLARDDRHFLVLPVIRPGQDALEGDDGLINALDRASRSVGLPVNRATLRRSVLEAKPNDPAALAETLQQISQAQRTAPLPGEAEESPPTLVMPVDQAEELFQADGAEAAERFLHLIRALAAREEVPLMILFTIRSDSYEHLQISAAMEGVRPRLFSLAPMPQGNYQMVIEGPAKRLNEAGGKLAIEPQLTQRLLEDIQRAGSKDALPLLAFTMERLYRDYGGDGDLRLDEYEDMRGINGAIHAAVEQALIAGENDCRLPNDRDALLKLLRRGLIPWLAGIDPDSQAPRRRIARASEIPEEARPIIEHLVEQRILATDVNDNGDTTIEPAHEALLRQWGLLKDWLEEDFSALATLESLQRATRDWLANEEADAWLNHSAGRLEEAEAVVARQDLQGFLQQDEKRYLRACRRAYDERSRKELEDAKALAAAQMTAVRRTRIGLMAAIVLTVAAGLLGLAAYLQGEKARAERDRANETLALVRDNLSFMSFELSQSIAAYVPTDVSEALTERMTQLVVQLEEQAGASTEDRRARATALQRRADILLRSSNSDLDEVEALLVRSFQLFQSLARESPDVPLHQANLAISHNRLGDIARAQGDLVAAGAAFQAALEIREALVAREPSNAEYQRNLSISHDRIGDVAREQGELAAARAAYEAALEVTEALVAGEPSNAEYQFDLSVSHEYLGYVAWAQGDLAAARSNYEAGLEIREALVARDPTNAQFQHSLSILHPKIGDIARVQGDLAAARAAYEEGLEIAEDLVARDPSNTEYQITLSLSHDKLGDIAGMQGDLTAARTEYEAGLEIRKALVARDSSNAGYQRGLSISHNKIGDIARAQGDLAEARTAYEAGLEIRKALVARDPSSAEYQRDLSISHERLGDIAGMQGDVDAARAAHAAGLEIREALVARDPSNVEYQRDLSISHERLGDIVRGQGDLAAARAAYEAGLEIVERLLARDPSNEEYQRDLRTLRAKLGRGQAK